MELKGKKISVIGMVRSGTGAAKLIKKYGGIPFVSDAAESNQINVYAEILSKVNISFEKGQHSEKVYDCDLMVVSPGVPSDSEVIKRALSKGIKVISEIELAWNFCKGKVVAITGTNGKTTTTALCAHVFNACGTKTYAAGNIGLAFSEIAADVKDNEIVSLEVSSFQLDMIDKFKPDIAMILNITPDHLNRYQNKIENYAASKMRIFMNQEESDSLIINKDSALILEYMPQAQSRTCYFSLSEPQITGCYLSGNKIIYNENASLTFSCDVEDLSIRGEHNIANAMAVITASKIFHFDNDSIRNGLSTFKGVEHRLEFVRELGGVTYINDSKATNVDSVWYALRSFDVPLFLILGGQDKGNDYFKIKDLVIEKVKKIYAIGASAEKIFNFFHKDVKVEIASGLEAAIISASKEARSGDVVLLSPACASFDMFENFEHRGQVFKESVNRL